MSFEVNGQESVYTSREDNFQRKNGKDAGREEVESVATPQNTFLLLGKT